MSGGLSVASSRFFVSGPKTGNTKQRKKDNFVGKDGGSREVVNGEGRRESRKGEGLGGRKKIIAKKKAKFCARKSNQEKRKTFLQPNFVPLPGKSHAPKKRLNWRGGLPEWAEASLKTLDWAGKDLVVKVFANCWK